MGEFEKLSIRLKELRKKLSMNQSQFSELIGISVATLSAYETGTKNPSLTVLKSISNKCEVSIDWLLGVEVPPAGIKTYGDLLQIIANISESTNLSIEQTFIENEYKTAACFDDPAIEKMLEEWGKIRALYDDNTIDYELYSSWIYKQKNTRNELLFKKKADTVVFNSFQEDDEDDIPF